MGEGLKQMLHGIPSPRAVVDDEMFESASVSTDSDDSISSSASYLIDDASSSTPRSSLLSSQVLDSDGYLYELSSRMTRLTIKRGLSKYYEGKSQSFASLSSVACIEDLAKKRPPHYRRRMRASKSYYGGGLDASRRTSYMLGPRNKAILKKVPRTSCASSVARSSSGGLLCSSK